METPPFQLVDENPLHHCKCLNPLVNKAVIFHAKIDCGMKVFLSRKLISFAMHIYIGVFRGRSGVCAFVRSIPRWSGCSKETAVEGFNRYVLVSSSFLVLNVRQVLGPTSRQCLYKGPLFFSGTQSLFRDFFKVYDGGKTFSKLKGTGFCLSVGTVSHFPMKMSMCRGTAVIRTAALAHACLFWYVLSP